jgi:tRNA (cytosine38-C5)-methyltransferase
MLSASLTPCFCAEKTSATRQILVSILHSLGYSTLELLLTPLQFGIPNSRLRYYLLAKKASLSFPHVDPRKSDKLGRCIPGRVDWLDLRLDPDAIDHGSPTNSVVYDLRRYLDRGYDPREVLVPDKVLKKWGRLFDIVLPSSRRTCCFTRGYTQLVERSGSVLQKNEILDVRCLINSFFLLPTDVSVSHRRNLRSMPSSRPRNEKNLKR